MADSFDVPGFYWHENAGARILLPAHLLVDQPFPMLYAKTKDGAESIVVTISSSQVQRQLAELVFHQLPRSTPPDVEVDIIRNDQVSSSYSGRELIWQINVRGSPRPTSYAWQRLLYTDESSGVIADIRVGGEGLFCEVEPRWQTVLDSFFWDPVNGVALKFDGDEIAHRTRYKKKIKRAKPDSLPTLPTIIRYLQPVVDELLSLPAEELNEDLDTSEIDQLLKQRIQGLSLEDAKNRLNADGETLKEWIEQDSQNRFAATFALAWIFSFDFASRSPEGLQ